MSKDAKARQKTRSLHTRRDDPERLRLSPALGDTRAGRFGRQGSRGGGWRRGCRLAGDG